MFVIEDGVSVTLKQMKDGLVLVLGSTSQQEPAPSLVVPVKKKESRKTLKHSGGKQIIDAKGQPKWLNMGERISKSTGHAYIYMKRNPAFDPNAVADEQSVPVTVVSEPQIAKLGQQDEA